ncbi:MAG: tRNA (adenosine(37)-N6)-threonylcarbamoyltransferase complex ATPase subunit type 1 TsaE, partial [Bdellovibrionales bacterium]|nr:tRNA (adenosine(37)-N6)-threonylcarbamoyltransferase complex ATPase subunit type 1 TsaE [Bdellovibrionales bacterium]
SLWKAVHNCDERSATELAKDLAQQIRRGDWILLEGPMGSGKSTFARALLKGFGFGLHPEGSPTFALAHEYEQAGLPTVIHIDLYRLESERDLEAAGIHSFFWERPEAVILAEWTSNFPTLVKALHEDESRSLWQVELEFVPREPLLRSIQITRR